MLCVRCNSGFEEIKRALGTAAALRTRQTVYDSFTRQVETPDLGTVRSYKSSHPIERIPVLREALTYNLFFSRRLPFSAGNSMTIMLFVSNSAAELGTLLVWCG